MNGCWPHYTVAHELFNTLYDVQLPFVFTKCPCPRCIIGTTKHRKHININSKPKYAQPLQSQPMHPTNNCRQQRIQLHAATHDSNSTTPSSLLTFPCVSQNNLSPCHTTPSTHSIASAYNID